MPGFEGRPDGADAPKDWHEETNQLPSFYSPKTKPLDGPSDNASAAVANSEPQQLDLSNPAVASVRAEDDDAVSTTSGAQIPPPSLL
ncbi:hypothetical protein CH063_16016, partial [Colletotrichum higginsianum]